MPVQSRQADLPLISSSSPHNNFWISDSHHGAHIDHAQARCTWAAVNQLASTQPMFSSFNVMRPGGCISLLSALCEGGHVPSVAHTTRFLKMGSNVCFFSRVAKDEVPGEQF